MNNKELQTYIDLLPGRKNRAIRRSPNFANIVGLAALVVAIIATITAYLL